jgi:putative FmdB family regulatory protein
MPIYEYTCKKCSQGFDALRWASEKDKPVICPRCGSEETERRLSVFSSRTSKENGCSPTGFS